MFNTIICAEAFTLAFWTKKQSKTKQNKSFIMGHSKQCSCTNQSQNKRFLIIFTHIQALTKSGLFLVFQSLNATL